MNKTEIVREIYDKSDKKVSLKDLDKIINSLIEIMSERLKKGEEIQLADFGTFSLAKKTIKPLVDR
jgi:nucleoid DNA-binding protein